MNTAHAEIVQLLERHARSGDGTRCCGPPFFDIDLRDLALGAHPSG